MEINSLEKCFILQKQMEIKNEIKTYEQNMCRKLEQEIFFTLKICHDFSCSFLRLQWILNENNKNS